MELMLDIVASKEGTGLVTISRQRKVIHNWERNMMEEVAGPCCNVP
jgi:hypothetical protein